MANIHLYDNQTGAWSSSTPGSGFNCTIGVGFGGSITGYVNAIRWYKIASSSDCKPSRLRIWNQSGWSLLYDSSVVPSVSDTGWVTVPISGGLAVTGGNSYCVGIDWPVGQAWPYQTNTRNAAPTPLVFDDSLRFYSAAGTFGAPTTEDSGNPWGVDIAWSTSVESDGGALPVEVANGWALVDPSPWLSSNATTQLHETDGLPWLTYQAIADLQDDVTTLLGSIPAGLGTDVAAIKTSVGTGLAGKVDDVLTSVGTGLNALVTAHKAAWDLWETGWDTFLSTYGPVFTNTGEFLSGVADWTGLRWLDWLGTSYTAIGKWMAGTPPAGYEWAQVDSTPFDTDLAWSVAADLYLVTWATTPASLAPQAVDGVAMYRRLAWWAEWDGNQAGERHYLDFPAGFIQTPGKQMGGLLLSCYGPCTGTVTAWVYQQTP